MRRAARTGIACFAAGAMLVGMTLASAASSIRYTDGSIVVLDARSGSLRWAVEGDRQTYYQVGAIGTSLLAANAGRCSRSDDGLVGSHVVAFDTKTGDRRWESKVRGSVVSTIIGEGVGKGVVLVQESGRLATVGLDASDGHRVWTIDASLVAATTDTVFTQQSNVAVIDAYDRATGKAQWSHAFETSGLSPFIQQAVVASNRDVTILANGGFSGGTTTASGSFQPFAPTTLTAVDTRTGVERFHVDGVEPYLTGAKGVLGTSVLAYINRNEIVGLDLGSGATKWHVPFPNAASSGAPPGAPPGLFYGTDNGRVIVASVPSLTIAIDVQTGTTLWTQPAIALRSPGVSGRTPVLVFQLGSGDTHLVDALDPSTGKRRWTIAIQDSHGLPDATITRGNIALSLACGIP